MLVNNWHAFICTENNVCFICFVLCVVLTCCLYCSGSAAASESDNQHSGSKQPRLLVLFLVLVALGYLVVLLPAVSTVCLLR